MREMIVFETIEAVFEEIKEIKKKYPQLEKVVLFGSRARGDNKYNSDIDLCVFAPASQYDAYFDFSMEVDDIYTHYSFDVLFFPHLSNEVIKNDILMEGVEL